MNKELVELYNNTSKHSGYQILPKALQAIMGDNVQQHIARYEAERMTYLKKHLDFSDKKILDIGGNTGYFSFESIEAGAKEVIYIEGNSAHEHFVKKAAEVLNSNMKTYNRYLEFENAPEHQPFDMVLLFNVIHHLGDDFGDRQITMQAAKTKMQLAIQYFYNYTDLLILQMGFCWKGDRTHLLFENGTKTEMIEFVQEAIKGKFKIENIGIAMEENGITEYKEYDPHNLERMDALGEFRNRPIFILKKIIE